MSLKTLYIKYKYQLKAMSPNYDVAYDHTDDNPFDFGSSNLSFACIADTHLVDNEAATVNLNNFFKDLDDGKNTTDAVLMAGDICDYGKIKEYNRFFGVFDNFKDKYKIFLTMGNHDVRFLFPRNQKIIMDKVNEYLNINTNGKSYYSYDIQGYKFIVIGTEKRVLEKAHITQDQIDFLDRELESATKEGKPAFVMCHQAFAETHGLPEVWKTGDMGEQNNEVREVIEKYKNVFFINGHLHGGVYEKTFETLNAENNVQSISIPCYRKENNFGHNECGVGYYCTVTDDKVTFKARNFLKGKPIDCDYSEMVYSIIK